MKKIILCLLSSFFVCSLCGQTAISINKAKEQGITFDSLDSIYTRATSDGTKSYVFENSEEVSNAWYKMISDVSSFLVKNKEILNLNISIFQRVYFNKDGKIDYYLFNIRNLDELTEEEVQLFTDLLNEFVKDYQFPLSADKGFSQCGNVNFQFKDPQNIDSE
mgnify:CR=1 FL=1